MKKGKGFVLGDRQEHAFKLLKEKLCSAPLLLFPNFDKAFEIEYDLHEWYKCCFDVGKKACSLF